MQIGEVTRFFELITVVGFVKASRLKLVSSHAGNSVDLPNIRNVHKDRLLVRLAGNPNELYLYSPSAVA